MNKSKIEWCDHTWNPITGCRHNCSYCYARRMTARFAGDVRLNLMAKKDYSIEPAADNSDNVFVLEEPMLNETGNTLVYPFGFEPTYHKYRMDYPEKLKMGNNIFVGAMADIFGKWVPDEWIRDVMETCLDNPIHNYLFLTKNPERYTEVGVPAGLENMWYGTTITCDADADRFNYLPAACNTFVSIEPLMGDIVSKHNVMFRQVDWIIIGAETGRNKNKIVDAVKGIGDKIKSFLHFSVPDEGPLTDYESWMPDFMGGLAEGISSNEDTVLDKVKGLAGGISTLMKGATASAATATGSAVNNTSNTTNVTQNNTFNNSYSGSDVQAQQNVSKGMKQSAQDATSYMAKGLAYAR